MARAGAVTFKGAPLTLSGEAVKVGEQAPDFTLHFYDDGLKTIDRAQLLGKPTIINVVASLDTPVSVAQTKRVDRDIAALGDKINAVTVSLDLPFAQSRFCAAEHVKNMRVGSDYQDRSFGQNWGMLIEELKILASGVFVLDSDGRVAYAETVSEMTEEPDFDTALATLKQLLERDALTPRDLARLEITLDTDFATFSEDDKRALLLRIQNLLKVDESGSPQIIDISSGSVKITLAVEPDFAVKLFWLINGGALDDLKVTDASMIEESIADALVDHKMREGEFDVFLCHNSEDKPEVKEIARRLMKYGLQPWLDEWALRPGTPWQQALESELDSIGSAAVFVGSDGVGPWQAMEIDALLREFVKRKCPVIPVLLESCPDEPELPLFLAGLTWVDFRSPSPDPFRKLLYGITGHRFGH